MGWLSGHCCALSTESAASYSRNGNEFKSFRTLNECVLDELKLPVPTVVDGEIVSLNDEGKPEFRDLLFRRGEPRFVAFDLLFCDGQDLRYAPLTERKHKLRSILPTGSDRLLYCGCTLRVMERPCTSLPARTTWKASSLSASADPYIANQTSWLKIRNTSYSQWEGREELFDRERDSDPDLSIWDGCVPACRTGMKTPGKH